MTTSSGKHQTILVSPWDSLSDETLTAIIVEVDGGVMIGFREAGAARGVDARGRSTTSRQTVDRMKQWLQEQGLTITWEFLLTPGVNATMPSSVSKDLVSRIRHHDNIDYLEPSIPGEYLVSEDLPRGSVLPTAMVTSVRNATGLAPSPSDRVAAQYTQPDGSTLRASTIVRQ